MSSPAFLSKNSALPTVNEKERLLGDSEKKPSGAAVTRPSSTATEDESADNGQYLLIYFIIMLICALGNRIFGRIVVYPMHNYPLFMNLVLAFIYIPVCWVYIIPVLMCFEGIITKEQQAIPKYKFAIMGAYDSLSSLLAVLATNYIKSSTLMVLVQQSAIPISMVVSKITLNATYTVAQYSGAIVVMLGIISVLVPKFFPPVVIPGMESDAAAAAAAADAASEMDLGQLCWLGVLVISTVPSVLSSVYKEKALGEVDVDVNYLNGWVAVFQFSLAIPLCLPTAQLQNVPLDAIPANLYGGFKCWMGTDTVTENYNPYGAPLDNCQNAPIYMTMYIIFNILFNIMTVVILKYGSANILWLASTMIVPLSNAVFSMKMFPGSKPMTPFDLLGLVIIMSGLVIYRFSGAVITLWNNIIGAEIDFDQLRKEQIARRITRRQERKQIMYMGLNQIENLQSLVDTRVLRAQMTQLVRTPRIIRENYLMKIGVPPSPQLSVKSFPSPAPSPSPHLSKKQFEMIGKRSNSLIGESKAPLPAYSGAAWRSSSSSRRGRRSSTTVWCGEGQLWCA